MFKYHLEVENSQACLNGSDKFVIEKCEQTKEIKSNSTRIPVERKLILEMKQAENLPSSYVTRNR